MEDLTKEQLDMLQKAFNAFDNQKNGYISTDMIATILDMLGHPQTDSNLQEIVSEIDVDGTGHLTFQDFCALAGRFMMMEEDDDEAIQQQLREAFVLYDKEGNGYITTEVLREILKELDDKLTSEDLDMMIDEIDSDGSGTVDFEEFMEIMTGE